jgi:hypothetical protein
MELLQYLRNRKNARVGVLLAIKTPDCANVHVAWSKCKLKAKGEKLDKFDPKRGVEIARQRLRGMLEKGRPQHEVPHSIRKTLNEFADRCRRYYKVEPENVVLV